MRLINTRTFELRSFADPAVAPPYAVLSHTHAVQSDRAEELTLADLQSFWVRRPRGARGPPVGRDDDDESPPRRRGKGRDDDDSPPRRRRKGRDDDSDYDDSDNGRRRRKGDRKGSGSNPRGTTTTTTTTITTVIRTKESGDDNDLVFDLTLARNTRPFGFAKLELLCAQAVRNGHDWAWMDTVCIDRQSSADVSAAVVGAWSIFARARVCYAYLADVRDAHTHWKDVMARGGFEGGPPPPAIPRWFTRSWTLLELLAPPRVDFFGRGWTYLGSRSEPGTVDGVARITGISVGILTGAARVEDVPVSRRLSWAAGRSCARPEDAAYSLMGLFGVHIQVLYGEGERSAWQRLQEEIMKQVDDQTLFCWDPSLALKPPKPSSSSGAAWPVDEPSNMGRLSGGMLAPSLACFGDNPNSPRRPISTSVLPYPATAFSVPPFTTPRGLRINLMTRRLRAPELALLPDPELPADFARDPAVVAAVRANDVYVAALDAVYTAHPNRRVKLLLVRLGPHQRGGAASTVSGSSAGGGGGGGEVGVIDFVRLPYLDAFQIPSSIVDVDPDPRDEDWRPTRCCVRAHAKPRRQVVAAELVIVDRGSFGYGVVEQIPGPPVRKDANPQLVLLDSPTVFSFLISTVDGDSDIDGIRGGRRPRRRRRPSIFVVFVLGYRDYVYADVFLVPDGTPADSESLADFHADFRERTRNRELEWEQLPLPARYGTVYALKRIVENMRLDIKVALEEGKVQDTYRLVLTMAEDR